MMDLGPWALLIWLSYAAVCIVFVALLVWLIMDGRRQQGLLDGLEARGITRRSRRSSSDDQDVESKDTGGATMNEAG